MEHETETGCRAQPSPMMLLITSDFLGLARPTGSKII